MVKHLQVFSILNELKKHHQVSFKIYYTEIRFRESMRFKICVKSQFHYVKTLETILKAE